LKERGSGKEGKDGKRERERAIKMYILTHTPTTTNADNIQT